MAAPITQTEDQREQRLSDVARLYLQGKTQSAIGKQLGVTQQQVCYDLKIVRERWLESSIRNFDEARAHELAKIDVVEREFWEGWHISERTNPRFLDGVMKCVAKRCEILCLDAPKKTSFTNAAGAIDYGPFLTEDERRDRLLALVTGQESNSSAGQRLLCNGSAPANAIRKVRSHRPAHHHRPLTSWKSNV